MTLVQPIEIPEPVPGDSDTVVTALEMATVFAAKGDRAEALRWLKRAIESATESGDDARILALARSAADLNYNESTPAPPSTTRPSQPQHARPLPKPPLKSNPANERPQAPPDVASDRSAATPLPLSRPGARLSAPDAAANAASARPPAPSSRVSSLPSAPRTSSIPIRSGSYSSSSRAPQEPTRVSTQPGFGVSEARASQVPSGAGASNSRTATLRQFPAVRVPAPDDTEPTAPGGQAPAPDPVVQRGRSLTPTPTPTPVADAKRPLASLPPALPALRSAARVSVSASTAEPGSYVLRVLREGEPVPAGGAEAYVVFVDPSAALLRSSG